jgi:predicted nucleic acid-binding protein
MLVDTSVWIDFFNGHESAEANHLVRAIQDAENVTIPGVVLTEILLGLKNDAEAKRIISLLDAFDYLAEPTRDDYIKAAHIYRQCRSKGITIRSTIDCLIAQLCLRDKLPLLTKDRDFNAIAHCVSLQLVSVN